METQEIRAASFVSDICEVVRRESDNLRSAGITPKLVAVLTDPDPVVAGYAESKSRMARDLGIIFDLVVLPAGSKQEDLETKLDELAQDAAVHGILLELPLAPGFELGQALDHIPSNKDVDGMTTRNLGLLFMNRESEAILPATPQACILLAESIRPLSGVRVGMVGKGRTVGMPLIAMLFNRHATVTVCHSETSDLRSPLADCEIVFTAVGKAGLLNRDNLREGQIVIDAGMSMVAGSLRGDLDAISTQGFLAAITPVPGGVGPVTTAFVFKNLIRAIKMNRV